MWNKFKINLSNVSFDLANKLRSIFYKKSENNFDKVNFLEDLEELLISYDVGVTTTKKLIEGISHLNFKKISLEELKESLAKEIINIMQPCEKDINLLIEGEDPFIILFIGVNGSGKTSSLAKLASIYSQKGYNQILVAADTFRSAAEDQLRFWGDFLNIPVWGEKNYFNDNTTSIKDPSSIIFDSFYQAKGQQHANIILIDTAGRLHTKSSLVDELSKIVRVLKKIKPTYPNEIILILDSTVGQNSLIQVEMFKEKLPISGIIITKMDGTAKGGILIRVADKFKLPIYFISSGEKKDSLKKFIARDFSHNLLEM